MKNIRFLWNNLWDSVGSVKTASSEETGYPIENLIQRWHTRCWRSTDDTAEWLKVNLQSALDVRAFVFKNHNFTAGATVKLQANATDSWSSPSIDDTLSITSGQLVKIYETVQNYQWWRLSMVDASNPDTYLKGGRLFLGDFFEPTMNFTDDHVRKLRDPSIKQYSSGGQVSSNQKTHYREFTYDFKWVYTPDEQTFEQIFNAVGQSLPYFICQDADDAINKTFYVQNANDWEIPHVFMDTWFKTTVVAEEMR